MLAGTERERRVLWCHRANGVSKEGSLMTGRYVDGRRTAHIIGVHIGIGEVGLHAILANLLRACMVVGSNARHCLRQWSCGGVLVTFAH